MPRCARFLRRVVTPVVYQFRFFLIFCNERWLQLVASGGRSAGCPGCSADVCRVNQLGKLQALWPPIPNYNEGIFPPWFRPGPCPNQNVSLQIGTSSYDTLVHMPLMLDWQRLFRGEDGPPSFQHSPRVNLYTTSEAIAESIMFSSNKVTALRLERTTSFR